VCFWLGSATLGGLWAGVDFTHQLSLLGEEFSPPSA
jgi:hypothetical protein